jgi:hypothetical protein
VTLRSGDAPECTLARNKAFHALFGAAGDVGDESDEMARVLERLGVAEPPAGAATQEGARVQFWSPSQGLRTLLVRRLPVLAVATNERVHHAVYLTDFDVRGGERAGERARRADVRGRRTSASRCASRTRCRPPTCRRRTRTW